MQFSDLINGEITIYFANNIVFKLNSFIEHSFREQFVPAIITTKKRFCCTSSTLIFSIQSVKILFTSLAIPVFR